MLLAILLFDKKPKNKTKKEIEKEVTNQFFQIGSIYLGLQIVNPSKLQFAIMILTWSGVFAPIHY